MIPEKRKKRSESARRRKEERKAKRRERHEQNHGVRDEWRKEEIETEKNTAACRISRALPDARSVSSGTDGGGEQLIARATVKVKQ